MSDQEFKGSDRLYQAGPPPEEMDPETRVRYDETVKSIERYQAAHGTPRPTPAPPTPPAAEIAAPPEAAPLGPRFTEEHAALLSSLLEWTSEEPIIKALLAERVADQDSLIDLAHALNRTADGPDVFVTERDARHLIETWLTNNAVRLVIAKRVASTHEGVTYEQARADLNGLLKDLQGERRVARLVVP